MNAASLEWPRRPNGIIRPIAGPGGIHEDMGFYMWICRVGGERPLVLKPPSGIAEQVLYVISGRGRLRLEGTDQSLAPLRVYAWQQSLPTTLLAARDQILEVVYFASPRSAPQGLTSTADLGTAEGVRFPAGRWGRSITNGSSPIRTSGFTSGLSILAPRGGQVPWHNHPDRQNEVYLLLSGRGEMCIDAEVEKLEPPAAVVIPGDCWHQLTNIHSDDELRLIYCYEGSVAAPHWWQERDGVLPVAGIDGNPPLPPEAFPQCTLSDPAAWVRQAEDHLRRKPPAPRDIDAEPFPRGRS